MRFARSFACLMDARAKVALTGRMPDCPASLAVPKTPAI
jgi:hypothetical protein